MAVSFEELTIKTDSGSPYQLNADQVVRASTALLKHIKSEVKNPAEDSTTRQLPFDDDSDAEDGGEAGDTVPVWLILTTKKHVVDKNRLKPGKIAVPHPLNTSPSLRICLITADPQREVKSVIADETFPKSLSSRITKVIGFSKLKERYKSFESRRQLFAEHDVFLADERIVLRLVQTLGKTFYKSSKKPIPIRIEEIQKVNGKRVKKDEKKRPPPGEKFAAVASVAVVAKEIEKALDCVPVHLAPSTTAAVRVGTSAFSSAQIAENIEAVVKGMTGKFIAKGWRNIKAIHVKGANTMALPIWLASELWLNETDVHENETKHNETPKKSDKKRKSIKASDDANSKKRKVVDAEDVEAELVASRKAKLKLQKAKARAEN
ncbi:proteasome-interacting protein cic1 [Ophidiomyces ophidiicola]|uniref:Proteasome-interacting protein cic1 n=1 Tax=Ophidiomyces ophidiicola TaxID=1387563 RepID=A0ACB8UUB4_9EURO|nr:proteasome-interacting protein cic1 [Ophidiomyces ophidiicola]KAI1914337.1 proteasome-interacting protein cic1 [Ophidiomyces ophidiicola]KAI1929149.1 proteasome-interacting protein cic1 [Ophidiomyces ophidiicola]KAI1948460.1 proteasome-interacting protein cic1 [Ophidiomyces ophidiicola]KAI1953106.1 proteasome-interacting protein cic1 [Ophidiomyces ophidiicola]KAI1963572.1 proteasome-interacting protein cic1 [Ophidiomyces ophidiicola]